MSPCRMARSAGPTPNPRHRDAPKHRRLRTPRPIAPRPAAPPCALRSKNEMSLRGHPANTPRMGCAPATPAAVSWNGLPPSSAPLCSRRGARACPSRSGRARPSRSGRGSGGEAPVVLMPPGGGSKRNVITPGASSSTLRLSPSICTHQVAGSGAPYASSISVGRPVLSPLLRRA